MRPKSKKGDQTMHGLISGEDWSDVINAPDADKKAEILADKLDTFMEQSYPTKRKKMRNTDDPWIDNAI